MIVTTRTRKVAVIAAITGLCAFVAGCVSDMGAPAASSSQSDQLRYYGGPKYPMWHGGQGPEVE
jgi:hypothetical protein